VSFVQCPAAAIAAILLGDPNIRDARSVAATLWLVAVKARFHNALPNRRIDRSGAAKLAARPP
jgi:hypothetical protein